MPHKGSFIQPTTTSSPPRPAMAALHGRKLFERRGTTHTEAARQCSGPLLPSWQLRQCNHPGFASADYKVNDKFGVRFGKVKTPSGCSNDVQDIDPAYMWSLLPQSIYPITSRTRNSLTTAVWRTGRSTSERIWASWNIAGWEVNVRTPPMTECCCPLGDAWSIQWNQRANLWRSPSLGKRPWPD